MDNKSMNKQYKSLRVNAFLSVLKVMLSIVTPLITFPYVSRVLGVENIGKINFGASIIVYITLLAGLGINTYAVREGARLRESKKKFTIFAKEIFTTNIFTTLGAYVVLIFILLIYSKLNAYRILIIIQSLSVIFTTIGVEWINTIYEDYFYILFRSFVVQIINIICLFLFVKQREDYYLYAILTIISTALISISNLIHVRRYCKLSLVFPCKFFKHIKFALVFFSSSLAVNIYMNADTTMIGLMVGDYYTGIYAVSVKMYTMAKTVLNCIYSVTIPRLSIFAEEKDFCNYKKTLTNITASLMLVLFPLVTFFLCLADSIIVVIAGSNYLDGVVALRILAIAIIFSLFNGILVNCINVTLNREKINLIGTFLAALVNICLNFIFIPLFKHNGAAITTLVAESVVFVYCVCKLKKIKEILDVSIINKQIVNALIGCIGISITCILMRILIKDIILSGIFSGIFGIIIYCLFLFVTRNQFFIMIVENIKFRD